MKNGIPLHYYPTYRKALIDLRNGIEGVGNNFKIYGMNNWRGMVAVIDMVLQNPEKLMCYGDLSEYDIPEPYLTKWKEKRKKLKERQTKNRGI